LLSPENLLGKPRLRGYPRNLNRLPFVLILREFRQS
jgi:hypothetical protein